MDTRHFVNEDRHRDDVEGYDQNDADLGHDVQTPRPPEFEDPSGQAGFDEAPDDNGFAAGDDDSDIGGRPPGISREEYEQILRERDLYKAHAQQAEAQQSSVHLQAQQQQWAAAEQEVWRRADDLDPDSAKALVKRFYDEKTNYDRKVAQAMVFSVAAVQYQDQLRKQYDLTDDEVNQLGANPYEMKQRAEQFKYIRDRVAQAENEAKRATTAVKADRRLKSGAGAIGGTRPSRGVQDVPYEKGSREHLLDIISAMNPPQR